MQRKKILMIDNYDSFTYNLVQYFGELGASLQVFRNDKISIKEIEDLDPDQIVISPGPCTPLEAGISNDVITHFTGKIPILGVCLGHQTIAEALGGRVVRADEPVHGRTSPIRHDGRGVFAGIPNPITGCRYHSLVVEEVSLPQCLEVSARTDDGTVMALRHRQLPVVGLQFHPASILTETGYPLLAGFLWQAGLPAAPLPEIESECLHRAEDIISVKRHPGVTHQVRADSVQ